MKKKQSMTCNVISAVLVLAFIVKTIVDYTQYSPLLTSAPFYVNILVNALCFILPALILFVIGIIVKKKS